MLRDTCDEKMATVPFPPPLQSWKFPSDHFSGEKYIPDHFFWLSSQISLHIPSLQPASPGFFLNPSTKAMLSWSSATELHLPSQNLSNSFIPLPRVFLPCRSGAVWSYKLSAAPRVLPAPDISSVAWRCTACPVVSRFTN